MTDYIAWLLEEPEEEAQQELAKGLPALRSRVKPLPPRKQASAKAVPRREGEEIQVAAPMQKDALPSGEVALTRGAAEEEPPAQETQEGVLEERLLPGLSPKGRAKAAVMQTLRRRDSQDTALADKSLAKEGGAPSLYQQLRRAQRAAAYLDRGQPATVLTVPEASAAQARNVSPLDLDRCFERDARRYDSGFSLL